DRDGLRDTVELTELRDLKLLGAVSDGLGGWLVYAQVGDHDFNTKTIEFRISPSLQADASYFATTAQYANFDILGDTYTAISAFTEEQDGVAFAITRRSTGSYLARFDVGTRDLGAHRTGGRFGVPVDDADEDDPNKYLILTNNDAEESVGDDGLDFADTTAEIPEGSLYPVDDDLARITLKRLGPLGGSGTYSVEVSNPAAVRLFKSDGTVLGNLTLDLALPAGNTYLADLATKDVEVWVEGLLPDSNLRLSLVQRDEDDEEVSRDDVHLTVANLSLQGSSDQPIPFVTRTTISDLMRAVQDRETTLDPEWQAPWSEPEESAKFRVRLDGRGMLSETEISFISEDQPADARNMTLSGSSDFLTTTDFNVMYRGTWPDTILSNYAVDRVRAELGVTPFHNAGLLVKIETADDIVRQVIKPTYTLSDVLADGRIDVAEVQDVELTDAEIRMVLTQSANGHYWTAANLDDHQKQRADENYPAFQNPALRYAFRAYDANLAQCRFILTFQQPEAQAYITETYQLLRGANPIHYVGETGFAIGSGYEPVLGTEVSRFGKAGELVLYLTLLKGIQWALNTTRGMAMTPLANGANTAAPADVIFRFPNGGRCHVAAGQRFTPEEAAAAFDAAAAGQQVTLGKIDIALGMYEHPMPGNLEAFAQLVRATHSRQWEQVGFYSKDEFLGWDDVFGRVVNATIARGGKIRFDLDGVNVPQALAGDHTVWVGRYTSWELQHIRRPSWFEHTVFYENGQVLTPQQVAAKGIQTWTPPE
ncbi:MAG TPA: hypothetical protein PLD59_01970, partial [Tepidisphaeraceae bacterium]|nr:hypothetical protein [Tepidisphaeraceae bacterium]